MVEESLLKGRRFPYEKLGPSTAKAKVPVPWRNREVRVSPSENRRFPLWRLRSPRRESSVQPVGERAEHLRRNLLRRQRGVVGFALDVEHEEVIQLRKQAHRDVAVPRG